MKNREKVFHVQRNGLNWNGGVMTVVTKVSTDDKSVDVGFAFCSPKDRFCKRTGRDLARKRMETNPLRTRFTGHSADDIVRLFNKNKFATELKPQIWKHGSLASVPECNLTFLNGPF